MYFKVKEKIYLPYNLKYDNSFSSRQRLRFTDKSSSTRLYFVFN